MSEIVTTLKGDVTQLIQALGQLKQASGSSASGLDQIGAAVSKLEAATEALQVEQAKLAAQIEKQAKQRTKVINETRVQTKSIEELATAAEMSASTLQRSGRSQELLIKIGGQYASILRETGSAQSDLMKTWRAGLSPAENSARKLVELTSATDAAKVSTEAFKLATGELGLRLEDQIRRQDANAGGQNKLARSLAELFNELKAAGVATAALNAKQAQNADTVEELTLAIQQLEFNTNDADKESQAYKDTLAALQARLKGVTEATEEQTRAYAKSKQRLDALETAMDALALPGSGLITRFKGIADALETMSEHGSTWQARALKVGIAFGAVSAGALAASAAVAGTIAALVSISAQADEWNRDLAKIGAALGPEGTARIEQAAAGIDSIGQVAKIAGVAIADTFSPFVGEASKRVVALGLAAIDTWKSLTKGADTLPALGNLIHESLVRVISDATVKLYDYAITVSKVGKIVGGPVVGPMFEGLGKALEATRGNLVEVADYAASELVDALAIKAKGAVQSLTDASKDYDAEAEKLIGKQLQLNRAQGKEGGAKAATEYASALKEITGYMVQISEVAPKLAETQGAVVSPVDPDAIKERIDKGISMSKEARDLLTQQWIDAGGMVLSGVASLASTWGTVIADQREQTGDQIESLEEEISRTTDSAARARLQKELKNLKERERAQYEHAMLAFRLEQGVNTAKIAIDTFSAAIGFLDDPGGYVGAGMAIGTGVLGAAAIAGVLSQPPPSPGGGGTAPGMSFDPSAYGAAKPITVDLPSNVIDQSKLPPGVQVSDAYIPPEGPRNLRLGPGDEAMINRADGLGRSAMAGRSEGLLEAVVEELRAMRGEWGALRSDLLLQRHRGMVSAPAGRY